jgi:hypothetical protein
MENKSGTAAGAADVSKKPYALEKQGCEIIKSPLLRTQVCDIMILDVLDVSAM